MTKGQTVQRFYVASVSVVIEPPLVSGIERLFRLWMLIRREVGCRLLLFVGSVRWEREHAWRELTFFGYISGSYHQCEKLLPLSRTSPSSQIFSTDLTKLVKHLGSYCFGRFVDNRPFACTVCSLTLLARRFDALKLPLWFKPNLKRAMIFWVFWIATWTKWHSNLLHRKRAVLGERVETKDGPLLWRCRISVTCCGGWKKPMIKNSANWERMGWKTWTKKTFFVVENTFIVIVYI